MNIPHDDPSRSIELRDPISEKINAFFLKHHHRLLHEALKTGFPNYLGAIRVSNWHELLTFDGTKNHLAYLQKVAEDMCQNHDLARLLLLFRRIPHQIYLAVLASLREEAQSVRVLSSLTYFESVVFGTNCILKNAKNSLWMMSHAMRYQWSPTESEMETVFRLAIISVLHRITAFSLNTLTRESLTSPVSSELLINSYNERLRLRWRPQISGERGSVLIYAQAVSAMPSNVHSWKSVGPDGRQFAGRFQNFFPVPVNAVKEIDNYTFLDTSEFTNKLGVPFGDWRILWTTLNSLLAENLPVLWPDEWPQQMNLDSFQAALERQDDLGETGLGGAIDESFWVSIYQILSRSQNFISIESCKSFCEALTTPGFSGDVRFTEQPFLFYRVGPKIVLWDYLRHAGLLRSIARKLSSEPNFKITAAKGAFLEKLVATEIQRELPNCTEIKQNIEIKSPGKNETAFEIDVGFQMGEVLVLVECKNEQKNARYYFNEGVVGRCEKWRERLSDADQNLKTHAKIVNEKWRGTERVRGAIYVICTVEAEFIATVDPLLWLESFKTPRICMLNELIAFLRKVPPERLIEHSAFVSFSS